MGFFDIELDWNQITEEIEKDLKQQTIKNKDPVCVCGSEKASKIQPYQTGHSKWCDVHESKRK